MSTALTIIKPRRDDHVAQLEALWLALAEERYQRELAQCEASRMRRRVEEMNPVMAHHVMGDRVDIG